MSGYYCAKCGRIYQRTRGILVCTNCGTIGLTPLVPGNAPRQVKCPQRGCTWSAWDDGHSGNDHLSPHLVRAHPRSKRAKTSIVGRKKR
jgi:hypothetical protein